MQYNITCSKVASNQPLIGGLMQLGERGVADINMLAGTITNVRT